MKPSLKDRDNVIVAMILHAVVYPAQEQVTRNQQVGRASAWCAAVAITMFILMILINL